MSWVRLIEGGLGMGMVLLVVFDGDDMASEVILRYISFKTRQNRTRKVVGSESE